MFKKNIILGIALLTSITYADTCDVYTNVIQTRNKDSAIYENDGNNNGDFKAYIYNKGNCVLNTNRVFKDDSHGIICVDNGGFARASGKLGASLDIDYTNNIEKTNVKEKPTCMNNVCLGENKTIKVSDTTLDKKNYNKIQQDYHHYNFKFTYSGDKKINNISNILGTVTFKNLDNNNLEIGTISAQPDGNRYAIINLNGKPDNIYIYTLNASNNKIILNNFEAKNEIKIHKFLLARYDNNVIIKAPKLVIDELKQTNFGCGESKITIYADNINIGKLDLGQKALLEIHPYTPGNKVTFHSDLIKSSSSSTILVSSGDYYTNIFDVPGANDVSSIRAIDNDQIISLYINGDFMPGNAPGINSKGNNGNFGDLDPTNFHLYINGDLKTGDKTTINALIYVEGKSDLGSVTYIRGTLSSGDDILYAEGDKFYWDDNIASTEYGACITPDNTEEDTESLSPEGKLIGKFNVVENTFTGNSDPININAPENQIKTKIANNLESFKILSLGTDNETLKNYNGYVKIDLINNPSNATECKNNSALKSDILNFDDKNYITYTTKFDTIQKNVRFRIKYFKDNSLVNTIKSCINEINEGKMVTPSRSCLNVSQKIKTKYNLCSSQCVPVSQENKINHNLDFFNCMKCMFDNYANSVCSRDNFAIRPDHFIITGSNNKVKAGENFNLEVKAVDAKGNIISNYNENASSLEFNTTNIDGKTVINPGTFTNLNKISFNNGIANINNISYDEVNNLAFKLQEKLGNEYAHVDADDTLDNERLIPTKTAFNIRFIPYKLDAIVDLSNAQVNKTYLSNGINYGNMKITVKALNKNNKITKNYSNGLYANDININIVLNSKPIEYIYLNGNKVKNITLNSISKTGFNNGKIIINNKINFAKNYITPKKPFNLDIKEIRVSDSDVNSISNTINGNINFVYGKLATINKIVKNNTIDLPLQIVYYNNNGQWKIDKDYNTKAIKNILFNPPLVNLNSDTITNGIEILNITYTGVTYPQTTTIHIDIPEYLWQSNFGLLYKKPSISNYDCNTHPCIQVEFIKDTDVNSKWLGIKSNKNSKDVNNGILPINSSNKAFNRLN